MTRNAARMANGFIERLQHFDAVPATLEFLHERGIKARLEF